jgi:hypothetical protein
MEDLLEFLRMSGKTPNDSDFGRDGGLPREGLQLEEQQMGMLSSAES